MKPSAIAILRLLIAAIASAALLAACSTTSRIPDDDMLYTGMKKLYIAKTPDSTKISPELKSQIKKTVNVPPNNYIKLLEWRYPFPIGLWVYNHWKEPKHAFGRWFYDKLVEQPVLMSQVRPEVRTHMVEQILDNNGYFHGTATYRLSQGRNKKAARVIYDVVPGDPFPIDTMIFIEPTTPLTHLIDSLARHDQYLTMRDPIYNVDSLSVARTRITNMLRNRGYYFFRPEFIEYLADTIANPGKVAMKMVLASNTPGMALRKYRTGNVTIRIDRNQGGGYADTIKLRRATLIQMKPSRLRVPSIDECISFRPGSTFTVRSMDRTQTNLARLGIFNGINIEALPDTTGGHTDILNVDISAQFDTPLEISLEANASSKSNSYIGPGLIFGVTNKNLFGGGEQLSVRLTGSYEWQTGPGHGSAFNSYEAGVTGSLSFPRLLAPRFIPRSRFQLNWTRFQLNADLLNRPHYFRIGQFGGSMVYDWRVRRYVQNTFTLIKVTYNKLMNTTPEFDAIMEANPAVAQSFKSQFIPQMMYQYQYDRAIDSKNTLNWQFTIQEAGNVLWAAYRACGKAGEKRLFGTPFSQFVKGQTQLVWGRRIFHGDNWLVSRVAVGAAHAYANSTQVPYSEQFYIGGANSVRAFTVRSIGPGSYKAPAGTPEENFDRTGTFKFEANVEWRFPIWGPVHGAMFLDAGNVWLLKDDPMRPGGTLHGKTFLRDIALGTGVGLRLDISMLVIRGDLGIGLHAPYNTGHRGYYNMSSFGNSLAFHLAIGYPF